MSESPGKMRLHKHLIEMHPGSRIWSTWTKAYMIRAHDAFHRRDSSLLESAQHYDEHIDNGWKP